MRWLLLFGVIAIALSGCQSRGSQHLRAVRADPNAVAINLFYNKSDGAPLLDAQPSDFEVHSSSSQVLVRILGVKESLCERTDPPRSRSIVLAMDQSQSLSETDPTGLRLPSAIEVVERLPSDTRIGFVGFASHGFSYADYDVFVPLSQGTPSQVVSALRGRSPNNFTVHGTPIWNTLCGVMETMLSQEPSTRERWVVCFTDGKNETPFEVPNRTPQEVLMLAKRTQTRILFILLGDEQTIEDYPTVLATLQQLAEGTGGAVVPVQEAEALQSAFGTLGGMMNYQPCYNLLVELTPLGRSTLPDQLEIRLRSKRVGKERRYIVDTRQRTAQLAP